MYKAINGWTKEKMKAQIRLKNNGDKSVSRGGDSCAYRGIRDNACGVGCFIPDECYEMRMDVDTPGPAALLNLYPHLAEHMPLNTLDLTDLQAAHDSYYDGGDMRDHLCDWIDNNVRDSSEEFKS